MKKIITYVLFGNEPRYWSNIPYLLVANSAIYPEFYMRFYVHSESAANPCLGLLQEVSKNNNKVEIEIIDVPYVGTQLTAWRVKPLWENDVDVLLCRDVDYSINRLERKSVEYFRFQDKCIVHGIRSYHLHTAPYMAGLCGFKVRRVIKKIKPIACCFEDFLLWGVKNVSYCKDWIWGCDQALLRDFLGSANLYPYTLDCPQYTAPLRICAFPAELCTPEMYSEICLRSCDEKALDFSESISPGFTGQAWTCRTDDLETLCDLVDNETSKIVKAFI